jgi:hypothetical protein
MSEPTASKTAPKKPDITYEQVMAKARSLCDQLKLTTSWMHEKLESDEYKDSDLPKLAAELDEFIAAYEKANPAP